MEQIVRGKPPQRDARMSARERFRRYRKETGRRCRSPDVKRDDTMDGLMDAWRACKIENDWDYEVAYPMFKGFDCSPEEVQRFCIAAKQFEDESMFDYKLGFVLSALMNASSHGRFELSLCHLDTRPASLCTDNTKKIEVTGDVGDHFGVGMEDGEILLIGDAGVDLGRSMEGGRIAVLGSACSAGEFMLGGRIEISGNVETVGMHMEGGLIIVQGDCERSIGTGMKGGEIHIWGDGGEISPRFVAGRIYHKGKLIVDK